ncbi:hypothetical protein AB751O23_AC_00400 [Chlamydiales bacterium SCGC AB-751-O23]|jgi:hypothetical protein|nr:hypothetical protein AB751O23_AC_00400 [Chlamydiales bacterium SCGC AB-751-O23]
MGIQGFDKTAFQGVIDYCRSNSVASLKFLKENFQEVTSLATNRLSKLKVSDLGQFKDASLKYLKENPLTVTGAVACCRNKLTVKNFRSLGDAGFKCVKRNPLTITSTALAVLIFYILKSKYNASLLATKVLTKKTESEQKEADISKANPGTPERPYSTKENASTPKLNNGNDYSDLDLFALFARTPKNKFKEGE